MVEPQMEDYSRGVEKLEEGCGRMMDILIIWESTFG